MIRISFRWASLVWAILATITADISICRGQEPIGELLPWGDSEPFAISAKYFCETDSSIGYLIVQVDLAEGRYLYSLTQPGQLATKIEVSFGGDAKSAGVLRPMSPPDIKAKDELLQGPSEKHFDSVQFALPFRRVTSRAPGDWKVAIRVNGQVCSEVGSCILIQNQVIGARFETLDDRTRRALLDYLPDGTAKR